MEVKSGQNLGWGWAQVQFHSKGSSLTLVRFNGWKSGRIWDRIKGCFSAACLGFSSRFVSSLRRMNMTALCVLG